MMSTPSWVDHIERLKDRFQLIIYDMRDQGQSARLDEGYDNHIHVQDLKKLLDHLNIDKADLWGVSYGGQIRPGRSPLPRDLMTLCRTIWVGCTLT